MLELLYATGIRVSELIGLELQDVNLAVGFLTCRDGEKERVIPFDKKVNQYLRAYLDKARPDLLKENDSSWLFTNCSGKQMSRQGFWKIVKYYGTRPGSRQISLPTPCAIPLPPISSAAERIFRLCRPCWDMQIWLPHWLIRGISRNSTKSQIM